MMDALLEIEIAYSILRDTQAEGRDVHFVDSYYIKLQADISVLDRESPEFKTIQLYVRNTHAETHRTYDLEIVEVRRLSTRVQIYIFRIYIQTFISGFQSEQTMRRQEIQTI